jgi:hypothetical protein
MTKEERKIYMKEWRKANKEKVSASYKDWVGQNRQSKNDSNERYRCKNKEKIRIINEKYRKNNKETIRLGKKEYENKNKHITAWRNVLKCYLRRLVKSKEDRTIELLGYSSLELKLHIEYLFTEGMSWDNYGEWHVDHIKQVVNYPIDTHPSVVNALNNLRPLWATTREINDVIYEGNLNRKKK